MYESRRRRKVVRESLRIPDGEQLYSLVPKMIALSMFPRVPRKKEHDNHADQTNNCSYNLSQLY